MTAGYLLAALLIVVPVAEATLAVLPMSPTETAWRFGAVGLYSRSILVPLMGFALAAALAVTMAHRHALRWLSGFAGGVTIVLVVAGGLFVLDALEMSSRMRPEAQLAFRMASASALAKIFAVSVVMALFAHGGWASTGLPAGRKRRQREQAALLLRPGRTAGATE